MKAQASSISAIGPDFSEAKAFLDILHPNEKVTFQTVPQEDSDFEAKIIHGYLEDVWDELVEWNVRGANIYCLVNRGNGKGRSMHCIKAILGFFVSVRNAPIDRLNVFPMKPHVIVSIDEDSWQAHWRVIPKEFSYPQRFKAAEFYKKVQYALASKVGGDLSCTDLARCCHVPGFFTYRDSEYKVGLRTFEADPISDFMTVFPVS